MYVCMCMCVYVYLLPLVPLQAGVQILKGGLLQRAIEQLVDSPTEVETAPPHLGERLEQVLFQVVFVFVIPLAIVVIVDLFEKLKRFLGEPDVGHDAR